MVQGWNGGSLSRTPGFFDIIQAFLPKMPKLSLSRVFCIYTDKSGVCRFIQSLLSKQEFCLHKILNEPPFIPDPISPPANNTPAAPLSIYSPPLIAAASRNINSLVHYYFNVVEENKSKFHIYANTFSANICGYFCSHWPSHFTSAH